MDKIYSSIKPEILLHVIYKINDLKKERENLSEYKEALQASAMKFGLGKIIKPHRHLKNPKRTEITQEALIIISGEIEASYYDINGKLIKKASLREGDCSITFHGGHSFTSLKDDSLVYEIKNGPYRESDKDKVKIGN